MHYTQGVSKRLNEAMERSDNFDALGQKLVGMFTENQKLVAFLQNHYDSLDTSHQLISTAVGRVGNTLDESLEKLKLFTQERINEIQKITLREMDLLQNEYPEKWKKLDSLSYLETMNRNLADLKSGNIQQGEKMSREFRELNSSFDKAVMELVRLRERNDNHVGEAGDDLFQAAGT